MGRRRKVNPKGTSGEAHRTGIQQKGVRSPSDNVSIGSAMVKVMESASALQPGSIRTQLGSMATVGDVTSPDAPTPDTDPDEFTTTKHNTKRELSDQKTFIVSIDYQAQRAEFQHDMEQWQMELGQKKWIEFSEDIARMAESWTAQPVRSAVETVNKQLDEKAGGDGAMDQKVNPMDPRVGAGK